MNVIQSFPNKPLKNIFAAAVTRQRQAKKYGLCMINEHSEPVLTPGGNTPDSFLTAASTGIIWNYQACRAWKDPANIHESAWIKISNLLILYLTHLRYSEIRCLFYNNLWNE
jgi:hypothetical protein